MTAPTIDPAQATIEADAGERCEVLHVLLLTTTGGANIRHQERCNQAAVARLIAACPNSHVETVLLCTICRDGITSGDPTGCDLCDAPLAVVALEPLR